MTTCDWAFYFREAEWRSVTQEITDGDLSVDSDSIVDFFWKSAILP